jgi:AGCS family alanine or glycine:cation symporter
VLLAVIIFLLAFTSILGNYYYGESNLRYISARRSTLQTFRALVVVVVLAGSVASADLVWNLADGLMAVMALINLVALLLLSRLGLALLRDYGDQRRAGLDPVFTRDRLPPGVTGVECWEDEETVRGTGRVAGGGRRGGSAVAE